MVAALLVIALCPAADAQPAGTVGVDVYTFDCHGSGIGNVNVLVSGRTIKSDPLGHTGGTFVSPGAVSLSAIQPSQPQAKLDHVDYYPSGASGHQTLKPDGSGTVSFNTGANGGLAIAFMCESKLITVRIGTTSSCTDQPNQAMHAQGGVTVTIGGKFYTSNVNGIIEVQLTPGTYPINAAYKDDVLGYVADNGLRIARSENGTFNVRLTGNTNLEVRMLTCQLNGQPKARAVITAISAGSFKVYRTNAKGNGFVGMQLRDGDQVYVQGNATIRWLSDGGTIAFKGYAQFTIGPEAPAGTSQQATRASPGAMQLIDGIIEYLSPSSEDAGAERFKASTHTFVAAIDGTHFILSYDQKTQVGSLSVSQGRVTVTPKNKALKAVTLRAGQRVSVTPTRVGPVAAAAGVGAIPGVAATPAAKAASATFGQVIQQAEQRDATGKLTVEAARIIPFACGGKSYYLYHYVSRPAGQPAFRAILPPDYAHPLGGKDFSTSAQAVTAACSGVGTSR